MNGKYLSQAVKILVLVSLAGVSVTAEANPPSRPPSGYNDAGVQLNRTREYIEREQIARRIQEERNKQQFRKSWPRRQKAARLCLKAQIALFLLRQKWLLLLSALQAGEAEDVAGLHCSFR